jgi:hypothetical protein
VVFSCRVGERQLIAEEIVKLEIWPGGPRTLTQPKLLRPIGVAVFTSHQEDADNLLDNEIQEYAYTRRSKDSISTYNMVEMLHNVAQDGRVDGATVPATAATPSRRNPMHLEHLLLQVTGCKIG